MSKLEKWFLKRIMKKVVLQGDHRVRIISFYMSFINCARNEFVEDDRGTFDNFMSGCHCDALAGNDNKDSYPDGTTW